MLLAAALMALCLPATAAQGAVLVHPLFADHAVLQQAMAVPVWGQAAPGENITVRIAGQSASTSAGPDGSWQVQLAPMKAGGPHTMTISGTNELVLVDLLVGEVWLASGQSNMERQLGPRFGQKPIDDWEKEAAAATYPRLRHFGVAQKTALVPLTTVHGQWEVCTPEAVKEFTAVGYFFGRDLHRARQVPVGLIHSSWGGTPAEAWTSEAALRTLPDFRELAEQLQLLRVDPPAARRHYERRLEAWFVASDPGSAAGQSWSDPALNTSDWKSMLVPNLWETAGEPELNGVVWFRKSFELPREAAALPAELHLGMVDDIDTTWINGVKVGATAGYDVVRRYSVPAGVLKPGSNVVVVRVLDTGGGGGIWGADKPRLALAGKNAPKPIDLAGAWRYRVGTDLRHQAPPPVGVIGDSGTPTVLYNGMIAPLLPYAIRGVIWYQGEANVHRESQYRTLFPALIGDWRRAWGRELPFLFVQIAPHQDMTPELREAQLWTWQQTPKTAMAVTTDCGDAGDIHPSRKQPVGARLALAARAVAYGERIEFSGPVFQSLQRRASQAIVRFTHAGGGLVAKGGPPLTGFTVAGPDGVFHQAQATARGKTVIVTSEAVSQPVAVRYGWANVPVGNLFNKAGLPASPFRTDAPEVAGTN